MSGIHCFFLDTCRQILLYKARPLSLFEVRKQKSLKIQRRSRFYDPPICLCHALSCYTSVILGVRVGTITCLMSPVVPKCMHPTSFKLRKAGCGLEAPLLPRGIHDHRNSIDLNPRSQRLAKAWADHSRHLWVSRPRPATKQ